MPTDQLAQLAAAKDWLAKNPNDPLAPGVKAKISQLVQARTAERPNTQPQPKSTSTISPAVPPRAPSSWTDPRSAEDVAEDAKHGSTAVAAHYLSKLLPFAGSVAGGAGAGALSIPAGPAAVLTGAAGAGLGQGAGRYAQIGADKMLGYPTPDPESLETAKQVLKEAAITSTLQAIPGISALGAGKYAEGAADGKLRDVMLWWAKNQGAMTPARAAQIKSTQLETVSPETLQQLSDASGGGKGAVPAAATIADQLKSKARVAGEVGPALRGAPLDQLDDDAAQQLLEAAGGGGENTPAAAKALASDFRRRADLARAAKTAEATAPAAAEPEMAPANAKALATDYRGRAQVGREAMKADALAPDRVPDMGSTYAADARSSWLQRHLPTAESGADAMTNMPGIEQSVRQANLAPLNDDVIQSIRSKLTPPADPVRLEAAFRNKGTGRVVSTGPIHDPDAVNFDRATWDDGFVDQAGKYYSRAEAKAAVDSQGIPTNPSKGWMRPGTLYGEQIAPQGIETLNQSRAAGLAGAREVRSIPPQIEQTLSSLAPADRAAALKQLGFSAPVAPPAVDNESVQNVFDNLRSNVAVAGDASFQGKATKLLDASARERALTDTLQSSRGAAAQARGTFGQDFTPSSAAAMGTERAASADAASRGYAVRDQAVQRSQAAQDAGKVRTAFDASKSPLFYDTEANNLDQLVESTMRAREARESAAGAGAVRDAFGANRDPLYFDTQANILDSAATAGTKAQGALAKADAAGVDPTLATQYGTDARSLDAFVNANTKRGLQRETGNGIMSTAALMGNRFRHALAESSPWSAGGAVPKVADAASSLEAESIARGLPPLNQTLRDAMQAPNNPAATRAAVSALSSWLYGNQGANAP